MMTDGDLTGAGVADGPVSPDNYKRAVYRAPPPRFSVEMLPPTKQGGSFSYGMRISPIVLDDDSISSNIEYEVWRRWEDCLIFQETLETEYRRMARSKKQRLVAGKGLKKNGIYIHEQAASFDSLPPGPHPDSVALNIHAYLPKLTKKGTLFRASPATINQRNTELNALIRTLFDPDAPALLKELRQERLITDFFGFWRRDEDLARKQKREIARSPRLSISSSVFSQYFTPSEDLPPIPVLPPTIVDSPHSPRRRPNQSSGTLALSVPSHSDDDHRARSYRRASSDSSSGASSVYSKSSYHESPIIVPQDVPISFGHKPDVSESYAQDRQASVLQPLPEDGEFVASDSSMQFSAAGILPSARRLPKGNPNRQVNRNGKIFMAPPLSLKTNTADEREADSPIDPCSTLASRRSTRESWQTNTSVSDYLDRLNLPLTPVSELSHQSRASISSFATFRTDCSADAVIPRSSSPTTLARSLSGGSRPGKSSAFYSDSGSEGENAIEDDFYDAFAAIHVGSSSRSLEKRPQTALGHLSSASSANNSTHLSSFFRPSSGSSTSTSPPTSFYDDASRSPKPTPKSPSFSDPPASPTGTLSIKAAHNNSIIIMRAPRAITFDALKKRLYDKFVGQEGVPLSRSFTVAHVMHSTGAASSDNGRSRSESTSSGSVSGATEMHFITSQKEWEHAISGISFMDKLILRVLDTPS